MGGSNHSLFAEKPMSLTKDDPPESTTPTSVAQPFKMANRPGRLRVRYMDDPVIEVDLAHGSAITFGRSREADILVNDQSVSKVHFSLRAVAAGVELEDLGSKNGTWYASRSVRRITLRPGDEFWAAPARAWTAKRAWGGQDLAPDHAL